jgi:hypothetical protein
MIRNSEYCNQSRKYFTENSADYFGAISYFTDYARHTLPRNLVRWTGIDAQKGISRTSKKKRPQAKDNDPYGYSVLLGEFGDRKVPTNWPRFRLFSPDIQSYSRT